MVKSNFYTSYVKRLLDIVLASVFMLGFFWLYFLIGFCYVVLLQFPVIFRQARIGKNEIPFTIYKFRTLINNEGLPLAEREFPLGKFMRSTGLDELPQIWNVLVGDMSLVGPRPLPVSYLPRFSSLQRQRHVVRPGVTGWAQVNGKHGISWPEKFSFDLFYICNASLALDLKIIFMTFILFISRKGDISLSEKPFTGEQ